MKAFNELLHELKNKDVRTMIYKELSEEDLKSVAKVIDDKHKIKALGELLHDLKNKDVKSLILKELNPVDLEFVKKAIDNSYKINYSDDFFYCFDNSNKKLIKWIKDHVSQCQYIFTRGRQAGERCKDFAYPNRNFGSDRYCRTCLKKQPIKMLLEDKNAKEMRLKKQVIRIPVDYN